MSSEATQSQPARQASTRGSVGLLRTGAQPSSHSPGEEVGQI